MCSTCIEYKYALKISFFTVVTRLHVYPLKFFKSIKENIQQNSSVEFKTKETIAKIGK